MEVPGEEVGWWWRKGAVTMDGDEIIEVKGVDGGETEVAGEGAVVIAGDNGEAGELKEPGKGVLDEQAFGGGGFGGVDEIAEDNEVEGTELSDDAEKFLAREVIAEGTEFAAAALGPAVTQMRVGDEEEAVVWEPEGAGGMSETSWTDFDHAG